MGDFSLYLSWPTRFSFYFLSPASWGGQRRFSEQLACSQSKPTTVLSLYSVPVSQHIWKRQLPYQMQCWMTFDSSFSLEAHFCKMFQKLFRTHLMIRNFTGTRFYQPHSANPNAASSPHIMISCFFPKLTWKWNSLLSPQHTHSLQVHGVSLMAAARAGFLCALNHATGNGNSNYSNTTQKWDQKTSNANSQSKEMSWEFYFPKRARCTAIFYLLKIGTLQA